MKLLNKKSLQKRVKIISFYLILVIFCSLYCALAINDKNNLKSVPDSLEKIRNNENLLLQDIDNWWESAYKFRTPINITNKDKIPLPKGYTINMSVNTLTLISNGRLRADGKDFRIVWYNSSNETWLELDRINETKFNRIDTQICFKTQSIIDPGETDNNYYLYYGYEDANNPPSNNSKIYDFYDDFTQPDGPAEGWSNTSGSSWTVINNVYREDEGVTNRRSILNSYTVENASIEIRLKSSGGTNICLGLLFRYQNSNNLYVVALGPWQSEVGFGKWSNGNLQKILTTASNNSELAYDQWYNLKLDVLGSQYLIYLDGILKINTTDSDILGIGQIGLITWTTSSTSYFDDLKIKKLITKTPLVLIGLEENQPTFKEWWNLSYKFRVPINITNRNKLPLPKGYSINISINTLQLISTGRLRFDGKDLRVVWYYSPENIWFELDRVNETRFNRIDTQIWFKTQTIIDPGETDKNYYLYYGCEDANDPPLNKSKVYDFYDDFTQPDGPAEGWSNTSGSSWTVINNEYRENEFKNNRRSLLNSYTVENASIEIRLKSSGGTDIGLGVIFRYINSSNLYAIALGGWQREVGFGKWINGNLSQVAVTSTTQNVLVYDHWYDFRVDILGSQYLIYLDRTLKINTSDIHHLNAGRVGLITYTTSTTSYFDDLKIKLLVAEVPRVDLGIEETFGTQFNYIVESADPLELGNTEIITVNITDLVDIIQVLIEIDEINHSMTHIGGDLWQYDSWVPINTGKHTYKIHSQNLNFKWSSITGSIHVIDSTPPSYSELDESADPLELGDTEIIRINAYDLSGVDQVLIELEGMNYTMTNIGGDTWQYDAWIPLSTGTYTYTIFLEDMNSNWNSVTDSIEVVDTTPPSYSDLIESADPLELGSTEIISIKVYDSTGISQVLIEFEGSNHSMSNIGGDTWQYDTWIPSNIGTYTYTIFLEDMNSNWNLITDSIEVIDTTPPSFTDLVESADPLELGDTEIIRINAYDLSGVDQVLIELEGINYTMTNIGGDAWQYDAWIPSSTGTYFYTIYIEDMNDNINIVIDSIEVIDNAPPSYSNLVESADPLELGATEIISINVYDSTGINQVIIEIEDVNYTMTNIGGDTWRYDAWTPSSTGTYLYTIYMEDMDGNWNSVTESIEVVDNTPPSYSDLVESADPLELGATEIIRINVYDFSGLNQILIEIEGINYTMNNIGGDTWRYDAWTPLSTGIYPYTIYMEDINNNWNLITDSIEVKDTVPPSYSELFESADPLELGDTETIRISAYDFSGVNQVLIEIEGVNYTMNSIGGDTWQHDAWTPVNTGIYPYIIYIEDMNSNWNSVTGFINIIDTTPPSYSDLMESADPLELGATEIIRINAYDLSGVDQVLIELEGMNYTMTNIGGDTWQYDAWIPSSTGTYSYTIYIEDMNVNLNSITDSIEIVDTTPPSYSNLVESADPLELGVTEIIEINIFDLSGINQVLIEIEGVNYTMTNIGGDKWQYNAWTPSSTGIYPYTIFMEDLDNNWNSITESIEVVDNAPPSYSNLSESADPLELGSTEIININVYDTIGINQVLIEIEGVNYTMTNIGGDKWQYNAWTPLSTGIYPYTIFMEDLDNNWNSVTESIEVVDTTPPSYSNLVESADPLELGATEIIEINIFDISGINKVLIEIEGINYTMTNIGGDTWQYGAWIPLSTGTYPYTLYIEDINTNWNSLSESIEVVDNTLPEIIIYEPDPYDQFGINPPEITVEIIDFDLDAVWYQLTDGYLSGNYTWLGYIDENVWELFGTGLVTITFFANDSTGNLGTAFIIISKDITAPDIIINYPNPYDKFGKIAPNIDIEVEAQDLDTIWYMLFNSTQSITDYSWTGSIEQYIWDNFNSGILTIRFYTNDTLGNTRYIDLTIIKDVTPPEIIIDKPDPFDLFGVIPPSIDIILIDDNIDEVWYQLSDGSVISENYTWIGSISQDIWDTLGNGTVKIIFYANDTLSNFQTQSVTVRKDVIAPYIFIDYPSNNTVFGNTPPNIELNVNEPNLDNTWYQITNGTITTGNYSWKGIIEQSIWDKIGNGTLNIIFYSNDTVGNLGFNILMIRKDTIAPKITIEMLNDLFGKTPPIIDVKFYDPHLSYMWYQLTNGTVITINYTWTGSIEQSIWDLFGNGSIIIIFYANDSLGNLGIEFLHIHKDVIPPKIIFDYPNPYEVFGKIVPNINVIINDKNINNIWYQLKNGSYTTQNYTWTGNLDQFVWDELGNGTVTIVFYANDLLGNLGFAEITILKDISAPIINIIDPENFTIFGQTPPEFKVYISGIDIYNCWYTLVGIKYFFTRSDGITIITINQTKWDEFGNGTLIIEFYVNDSVGNIGLDIIKLRKDIFAPKVKINLPIFEGYWNKPPIINISYFDPNYDSLWYRIGATNIFLTNNTEQVIDPVIWNNLEQGEFHLYIFANDTAGNINNTYTYTLFKDTFAPLIQINLPLNNTYSNVPPTFNIKCYDPNFDTLWYGDGNNNITLTNGTNQLLDWAIWNNLPDGKYQLIIYANDTFGYLNDHFILTLNKDTSAPEIIIYLPNNNTIYNQPPFLDIYAIDPNLQTLWYQIGEFSGVLENHLAQTIDQTIWNILPQGEFQIRIYANDSFGYLNNSFTLTLYKDTLAPRIVVNLPYNETYWNSRPKINITAYDPYLDKIWYKIGTVYSWLENNTETLITDYIWSNLPDGQFIIEVYANDYLGNINDASKLILYKDTSAPEITIFTPFNNTLYNQPPILDIYVLEPNLHTLWYEIGDFTGILQNHIGHEIDQIVWNNLPQGEFQLRICANDSFGYLNNNLIITLYKDTLAPNIIINQPIEYQEVGEIAPYFNLTIIEENLDTKWYTLDGGLTNFTFISNTQQIDQKSWNLIWRSSSDEDLIIIRFYANDTLDQLGSNEIIIQIMKPTEFFEVRNPTGFFFTGATGGILGIAMIIVKANKKYKRMDQKQKRKLDSIFLLSLTLISLLVLSFLF